MSETNISKKIITYDAIERYHDKLEQHINNDYLKKTDYKELFKSGSGSGSLIRTNSTLDLTNNAIGEGSFVIGSSTTAFDPNNIEYATVVEDWYNKKSYMLATGYYAYVNGSNNFCEGPFSCVNGLNNLCSTFNGNAEGTGNIVLGVGSHAEGVSNITLGMFAHAEGVGATLPFSEVTLLNNSISINQLRSMQDEYGINIACGQGSHTEGHYNIAFGMYSHAEGDNTIGEGIASHTEGYNTHAKGNGSHAEGNGSYAEGDYSHAEGYGTVTKNAYEHACGQYNASIQSSYKSQATHFSIGIGTSSQRKNALEVKQNGDIYIDGVEGRIQDKLNIDLLVPIEHNDLKKLRNNNQLIPGQKYRIIDYVTTTTQTNTRSAWNLFDVIVTAIDDHTLSENAYAIKSARDVDNYFETENLEAWQLKYCLDNDTERFAWADNSAVKWYSKIIANYTVDRRGTHPYLLDKESYIYDYGTAPHPDTGDYTLVFYAGDPMYFSDENGADYQDAYFYNGITTVDGVEYDSWQKYDTVWETWVNYTNYGEGIYALTERVVYNGEFVWPDNTDIENGKGVIYNMIDEYGNECPYDFKNIKFYHDGVNTDVYTFTWIDENYEVMDTSVFGNNGTLTLYGESYGVYGNVIKPYMVIISDRYSDGKTKQKLNNITFISDYMYEEGTGYEGFYGCYNNSFGNNCHSNSFGNNCHSNSFGNGCYNNSFGNDCNSNSFGNYCFSNIFGYSCYNNSFGNNCYNNSFGNNCFSNIFGYSCNCNSFGNNCYNNSFSNSCYNNSFSNSCYNNSFGNNCHSNSFGNSCCYNSFRLSASNTGTILNYCQTNHFDDNCSYNVIYTSTQPTTTNKLQNINVVRGVLGTSSNYNYIRVDRNLAYETKVAKNSSGDIKIYCEADLI